MPRKYIDCREAPSEMNCTVSIAADSDDELLEAVMQHVVSVHSEKDTPELRKEIRKMFKNERPHAA